MSSINNKLKKAVHKSLTQAETIAPEDTLDYLGIPKVKERPRDVSVYKIWYHNRAKLDHTKFPMERSKPMKDSPMFATWAEADKYAKTLEKEDKENMYWGMQTFIPINIIPATLLTKLKKRGW